MNMRQRLSETTQAKLISSLTYKDGCLSQDGSRQHSTNYYFPISQAFCAILE